MLLMTFGTTLVFSCNLAFQYFSKICRKNRI